MCLLWDLYNNKTHWGLLWSLWFWGNSGHLLKSFFENLQNIVKVIFIGRLLNVHFKSKVLFCLIQFLVHHTKRDLMNRRANENRSRLISSGHFPLNSLLPPHSHPLLSSLLYVNADNEKLKKKLPSLSFSTNACCPLRDNNVGVNTQRSS